MDCLQHAGEKCQTSDQIGMLFDLTVIADSWRCYYLDYPFTQQFVLSPDENPFAGPQKRHQI